MKTKLTFTIIVALTMFIAGIISGQEKEQAAPDSVVVKTELINKYEAEKKNVIDLMNKRLEEIAAADPIYNQLIGIKSTYERLLKELEPIAVKPKVKQ